MVFVLGLGSLVFGLGILNFELGALNFGWVCCSCSCLPPLPNAPASCPVSPRLLLFSLSVKIESWR